ncbi:MAG: hypothetical protein U0L77_01895, partial [Prevotellamassilia sp.]|nr:hypothetical protein [Prevotellamassilia sp.]
LTRRRKTEVARSNAQRAEGSVVEGKLIYYSLNFSRHKNRFSRHENPFSRHEEIIGGIAKGFIPF